MQAGDAAIVTRSLTKIFRVTRRHKGRWAGLRSFISPVYEHRKAVEDVTLTVQRGELVALLGPNGAGKSTSIKLMTGILTPSSGEVYVDGRVPHRDRTANARAIGAVFGQKTQLWWDLPARQSFALLRDIFNLSPAVYASQLEEFEGVLGIMEYWNTPVRQLSLGQRVRCEIAAAMLHNPPIVFLDEPTIGMDVVAKEKCREFLRYQVRDRGRTIVLTTHDMTEVAKLCERVILINHGRLVFDGTVDELKQEYGSRPCILVIFSRPVGTPAIAGARVISHDGLQAMLVADGTGTSEDLVRTLVSRFPIATLTIEEPDLEDLMRDVYQSRVGPAAARAGDLVTGVAARTWR